MKFGKILQHYERVMSPFPFIDYKRLKKVIRDDVLFNDALLVSDSPLSGSDGFSEPVDPFYRALLQEIAKCNTFFIQKERAILSALDELSKRVAENRVAASVEGVDLAEEIRKLRKYNVSERARARARPEVTRKREGERERRGDRAGAVKKPSFGSAKGLRTSVSPS